MRADIPWALDPKAEEDFLLELGGFEGTVRQGHEEPTLRDTISPSASNGGSPFTRQGSRTAFGLPLLIAPWLVAWFGFGLDRLFYDFSLAQDLLKPISLFTLLAVGMMSSLGARLLFRGWRNKAAERKLRSVHFSLDPSTLDASRRKTCR